MTAEDYADRYRDASIETLHDIAAYWRRDAAARLWKAVALYRHAEKHGDEDGMADIYVNDIRPTLAALDQVDAGELHERCAKCNGFIRPTEERQAFEGDGEGAIFSHVHATPECRWHPDDILPPDGDERWDECIAEARTLMREVDADVPEEPEAEDA